MEHEIKRIQKGHLFGGLFLANFVLSFHLFFTLYMNSSFIALSVGEKFVGLVYMVSSAVSIVTLISVARILRKFGNYKILLYLTILEFFLFMGMAFVKEEIFILLFFVTYSAIFPLMLFNFDVFLETYTKKESNTGNIRGTFLAITNTALILAPLIAGLILTNGDYWKIYFASALFLIPFLFLISRFKDFKDPEYHDLQLWDTLRCIKKNKNLYNIFMAQFMMRFFFSWMVIYMPIYLHQHIGFSWSEIGIMTSIVLLPFAIVEYPAGKIADKMFGEKELLIIGFLITATFTGFISFLTVPHFIIWTALLFTIRVGASLIEIMSEIYFFKHVDGSDNTTISFFRITNPFAYIVGPAVASFILLFTDYQFIFIVLGFILLYGMRFAFRIEDTI